MHSAASCDLKEDARCRFHSCAHAQGLKGASKQFSLVWLPLLGEKCRLHRAAAARCLFSCGHTYHQLPLFLSTRPLHFLGKVMNAASAVPVPV